MTKFLVQLDPGAKAPAEHKHANDVGYDVHVMQVEISVQTHDVIASVNTGVHIAPVDPSYYVQVFCNSRVAKVPFVLTNHVGIVDPDYRGPVYLKYRYNGAPTPDQQKYPNEPDKWNDLYSLIISVFAPGNVCGQFVVAKKYDAEWEVVEKLDETTRGDGGYGSTEQK